MPEPAAKTRPPLTPDRIVRAALTLIDADGLEGFSIRRLGDALGVHGMAVYRHLHSKEAILDGVRALLVREFAERLAEAAPFRGWRHHVQQFGLTYRAVAQAHPQAFPLMATGAPKAWSYGRDIAGAALAALLEAGFDEATAIGAERTVIRYVIGFSMIDAARAGTGADAPDLLDLERDDPALGRLVRSIEPDNTDELFALGLDLILDGLATRR